ncbi:cutinase family protein [Saccharopolyspora taberi]
MTRTRRIVAALGLVTGAVVGTALAQPASASAAPFSGSAACPDLEVVFARATGELPGLGTVGRPLVSAVQRELPGKSVGSYAVNYAASLDQTSAGPGATDMTNHVTQRAASCPDTKFVLGGFSQGASVTDIAVGIPGLGIGREIPSNLVGRVVAIAAFGNPLGGLYQKTITGSSPDYGPKALEICNATDLVCGGQGTLGPGLGHFSYPFDGSVDQAARFAAQRFVQAQRVSG